VVEHLLEAPRHAEPPVRRRLLPYAHRAIIDKPWPEVTVADGERLRDALDAKAQSRDISAKTAFNVSAMALPGRVLALVSCEVLPLEVRRLYALVTYLFLRGGELKALTWPDVDVERGIISVRRPYDRSTGRIKQTKTGNKGIRRFAVEPELLPLLRARHDAANGQGPVVDMRQQKWWAADLRKHLELAGITREALFDTDDTCKRLRFHDPPHIRDDPEVHPHGFGPPQLARSAPAWCAESQSNSSSYPTSRRDQSVTSTSRASTRPAMRTSRSVDRAERRRCSLRSDGGWAMAVGRCF
jgi:integrase